MPGLVSIPAVVGGTIGTSAWGQDVTANVQRIGGQGSDPYPKFALYQNTTQSIGSGGTGAALTMTNATLDNKSGWTSGSKWNCPAGWSGWYYLFGTVAWPAATTGNFETQIRVTGTTIPGGEHKMPVPNASVNGFVQAVGMAFLTGGVDYVEVWGVQSTGSSLSTVVSNPDCSTLSRFYLGVG